MKESSEIDEIYISTFIENKNSIKINEYLFMFIMGIFVYYSMRLIVNGFEHEDTILDNFYWMGATLILLVLALKEKPIKYKVFAHVWYYIILVLINMSSVLISFQIMYFFVEFSILVMKTSYFVDLTNDFLFQLIIIIIFGNPIYKLLINLSSNFQEINKVYNKKLFKFFTFMIYMISVLLLGNELYGGIIVESFFEEKKTIGLMIMLILPYLDLVKRYG